MSLSRIVFTPLDDNLLIRPNPVQETKGSFFVPDQSKEVPQIGEIVAVGPGRYTDSGHFIPMDLKVGQTVIYGKFAGSEVEIEDEKMMIMQRGEIRGTLERIWVPQPPARPTLTIPKDWLDTGHSSGPAEQIADARMHIPDEGVETSPVPDEDVEAIPAVAWDGFSLYQTYGDHANWTNFAGLAMPRWSDLPGAIQGYWNGVAEAVNRTLQLAPPAQDIEEKVDAAPNPMV